MVLPTGFNQTYQGGDVAKTAVSVLVVDDEPSIRSFLRAALAAHEYIVFEACDGKEALKSSVEHHPDLVILDLGLPDIDGVEVTRQIRKVSPVPIIILSVREHESDKIDALDAGADDYLTKPFGIGELLARMRVMFRRSGQSGNESLFQVDDLKVDLEGRHVTFKGQDLNLTPVEYDILTCLVHSAGKVVTHRKLIQKVWGSIYTADSHILRVNISNLRRKIEPDPSRPHYILTEPGVGYRLRTEL
jgi:two-component system, OmpR family, KDP operon response regulator KdpE